MDVTRLRLRKVVEPCSCWGVVQSTIGKRQCCRAAAPEASQPHDEVAVLFRLRAAVFIVPAAPAAGPAAAAAAAASAAALLSRILAAARRPRKGHESRQVATDPLAVPRASRRHIQPNHLP